MHCIIITLVGEGGLLAVTLFYNVIVGKIKPCSLPYTRALVGSRKYTTSRLEPLNRYFVLKVCTCYMQRMVIQSALVDVLYLEFRQ